MSEKEMLFPWHSPEFYRATRAVGSPRVSFIEHKGKRILVADFSRADLELVKATAAAYLHIMTAQPATSVLSLIDVEGILFSPEALQVGTEMAERGRPHALRSAMSGVTGFRSFVVQAVSKAARRPIKLFKDRSEALEWLVSDGEAE